MGEPAFLSEEFSHSTDPDVELVTTSGYGKNGALCVLQRSIRPQVVTTFELPGCEDMWTVVGSPNVEPQAKGEHEGQHAFLILSHEDSTMVLYFSPFLSSNIYLHTFYTLIHFLFKLSFNKSFFPHLRYCKPDKK